MSIKTSNDFLITYDISDHKKRRSLSLFLCGYGIRLQKSVFLCSLRPKQQQEVKKVLQDLSLDTQEAIHCFQINPVNTLPSPTHIPSLSWIID